MKIDDSEILKAIKFGNNQLVLNSLYKDDLPKIESYIRKNNGSADDAADVFQDAVIVLFTQVKQGKFKEEHSVSGYLYTIARNLWINKAKANQKSVHTNDFEKLDLSEETNVLNTLINKEKTGAIKELFSKLGGPCLELLKYQMYDKLSMKEICEKLNISNENVARVNNHRCKQKLLKLIEENPKYNSLIRDN